MTTGTPSSEDPLGWPHLHLRRTDSTNDRVRALAERGAPHGTLVTAAEQTAGRGRQGRSWSAPAGRALLMSLLLRDPPQLLALIAGVAVCDALGAPALLKWPNDVVLARGGGSQPALAKLAGILIEGRPQEGWAVLGIGVNVAVRPEDLPADLRDRAASLEREPSAVDGVRADVVAALAARLAQSPQQALAAWRERDALAGRRVSFNGGSGTADGLDAAGRLVVRLADGRRRELDAGEVHLALSAAD